MTRRARPWIEHLELAPEQLRAVVPPESIPFNTTARTGHHAGIFGQERAMAALDFGCGMDQPGYNVFASGPTGSGRNSAVLARGQGDRRQPRRPQRLVLRLQLR